jgi:hypothetical protein
MNNDVQSLLLVTTFLAVGGLGLYWYKTTQEENCDYLSEDEDDDESDFDIKSMDEDLDDISETSNTYEEPVKNKKNKTKNNRKNSGTKKKYNYKL